MRSVPLLVCVFFLLLPEYAQARSAMNRCYEDHGTNEAALFSCMEIEYMKREQTRKVIEEEIIKIVNNHKSKTYNSVRREKDLENLIQGRELFIDYRKLECGRQKTFLRRHGPQATFEYMVCMYDMTTQRIRTLQNSIKE